MPAHKIWPLGIRDRSDRSDRRDGSGAKMGARNPPPTRAGGQDDGSLNKLPQINPVDHVYIVLPVNSI